MRLNGASRVCRCLKIESAVSGVRSAPDTSSRSLSTQRTKCDGATESRTTVERLPSVFRMRAGTGSLSAR